MPAVAGAVGRRRRCLLGLGPAVPGADLHEDDDKAEHRLLALLNLRRPARRIPLFNGYAKDGKVRARWHTTFFSPPGEGEAGAIS